MVPTLNESTSIITEDLLDETLDNEWNGRAKLQYWTHQLNQLQNTDEIIVEFEDERTSLTPES